MDKFCTRRVSLHPTPIIKPLILRISIFLAEASGLAASCSALRVTGRYFPLGVILHRLVVKLGVAVEEVCKGVASGKLNYIEQKIVADKQICNQSC